MKLSKKQKYVIGLLREGYFLYENRITPGARWSLGKFKDSYRWGSVNGNVIDKLIKGGIIEGERKDIACYKYELTELGKTITI